MVKFHDLQQQLCLRNADSSFVIRFGRTKSESDGRHIQGDLNNNTKTTVD